MAKRDDIQQELQQRGNARSILDAAAKEMGFAVNSIRQEVIEKPWFGERVTPHSKFSSSERAIRPLIRPNSTCKTSGYNSMSEGQNTRNETENSGLKSKLISAKNGMITVAMLARD